MKTLKYLAVGIVLSLAVPFSANAQSKAVVVPFGDDLLTIPLPSAGADPDAPRLEDRIGKPIVINKGFDQTVNNDTMVDPRVKIELLNIRGDINGHREIGIIYSNNPADIDIVRWGLQRVFPAPPGVNIFAKGVLLIDRGDFAEGGPFEFSFTGQTQMSFFNIVRRDRNDVAWIRNWTDPRPGDKVWFYLQSDDERFSSNPITFTWPDSIF